MIELRKPRGLRQWAQLYKLYRSAFPAAERKPFGMIIGKYRKGKMDVWRIEREGAFFGLAITINGSDLILIDYLAIAEPHRGSGVGTATLALLQEMYAGKNVFLEIESVYENAPNQAQRERRKAFYLRCGLIPMRVMVYLFGEKMELLGFGDPIDYDTYLRFYCQNLGSWAANHIRSAEYPQI